MEEIFNTSDETLNSARHFLCTIRQHSNTLLVPLVQKYSIEKSIKHFEHILASVALIKRNCHQMEVKKLPFPMKTHADIQIWHDLMIQPIHHNIKSPHLPHHIQQDMQRVCTYNVSIGWSNNGTSASIYSHAGFCVCAIHKTIRHAKGSAIWNKLDAKLKLTTRLDHDSIHVTLPNFIRYNRLLQLLEQIQCTFTGHTVDIIRVEQKLPNNRFDNHDIDDNAHVWTAFDMRIEAVHESRPDLEELPLFVLCLQILVLSRHLYMSRW